MIRALLAFLIIVCPGALAQQQITVECNATHCEVPIPVMNALIAQARMNCGPIK